MSLEEGSKTFMGKETEFYLNGEYNAGKIWERGTTVLEQQNISLVGTRVNIKVLCDEITFCFQTLLSGMKHLINTVTVLKMLYSLKLFIVTHPWPYVNNKIQIMNGKGTLVELWHYNFICLSP